MKIICSFISILFVIISSSQAAPPIQSKPSIIPQLLCSSIRFEKDGFGRFESKNYDNLEKYPEGASKNFVFEGKREFPISIGTKVGFRFVFFCNDNTDKQFRFLVRHLHPPIMCEGFSRAKVISETTILVNSGILVIPSWKIESECELVPGKHTIEVYRYIEGDILKPVFREEFIFTINNKGQE
jgi:hypothetical protein